MRLSHRRTAKRTVARCAALVLASTPALLASVAAAQEDHDQDAARQTGLWLEPRVSLLHTVTSNVRLDATDISDHVTQVVPGFRLVSNTARIKGFVDYSLYGTHYVRDSTSEHVWHNLNASAVVEAVEQRFFVDLAGVVALQPISAFGTPVASSSANPNTSQTSSFRVSPYFRGNLGGDVDYEARYSVQDTRTAAAKRSDVTKQDWILHLGERAAGKTLGWSVEANHQTIDFSLGRNIDTTALRTRLSYATSPRLLFSGVAGAENTNHISPTRKSHAIWGAGIIWRPYERSQVALERESRYFGEAHNVTLEHRTRRTVWRYTDWRGISNGFSAHSASLGNIFELLDGYYTRFEKDPVRRTQLVFTELERLGIPSNTQAFQDFLSSSSTVRRLQQLSLALLGQRSTVTLAFSRSEDRLLDSTLRLGDDFDTNTQIRQRGWSLLLAHRLTQNASVHASLGEQRSMGTVPGLETRVRALVLGWNTLLTRRTSGGIQIRRVISDGASNRFNESAIVGIITHRF